MLTALSDAEIMVEPIRHSMNWVQKKSAWEDMKEHREKRKAMIEKFQEQSSSIVSAFSSAFSAQLNGTSENIGKTAVARIQQQAKEKQAEALDKAFSKLKSDSGTSSSATGTDSTGDGTSDDASSDSVDVTV